MKIKNWLMLSYLVVMILPLAAAYALYSWISAYDNNRGLSDYLKAGTEMKKVEQVLQDPKLYIYSEKAYQRLAKVVNDRVKLTLYDKNGLVLYNTRQEYVLGYQPKEMLYRDLYQMKAGYNSYTLKKPLLINGELTGFYQITLVRSEWVQGVQNRTGLVFVLLGLVVAALFIVVLKLVNHKLNRPVGLLMQSMTAFAGDDEDVPVNHRTKDEIGQLVKHFADMKDQIRQARREVARQQQEKEYMIAAISHDLKTPLTSIRAYAESMYLHHDRQLKEQQSKEQQSKEQQSKEQQEYISIILNKADYMLQMIEDLLTFTLLRSSIQNLEFVEVEGNEFFEMLLAGYDEVCQRQQVRLETECQVAGFFRVNVKHMSRVVDNLMSNALKYTPAGGCIWLAALSADSPLPGWVFPAFRDELADRQPGGMLLLVQNEGEGIPPDKLEKVFNPLYQGDPARSKQGSGAGLGLSIAKMVMEKHNGRISLFSRENAGTLIVCWLEEINN